MNRFGYNKDLPNDPWNYDSAGYIDLWENFADEVFRLIIK